MDEMEKQTVAEIAHAAQGLVADGMKSGAVAPLRDATILLDKLIAGDYEKPTRAERNSEELAADAVKTEATPELKPKSKPKARRARKSSR